MILVDIPVTREFQSAYRQEIWKQYLDEVSTSAREKGILFLRPTREECGLTDEDFIDYEHMSPPGAEKFSRCLLREIDASGMGTR